MCSFHGPSFRRSYYCPGVLGNIHSGPALLCFQQRKAEAVSLLRTRPVRLNCVTISGCFVIQNLMSSFIHDRSFKTAKEDTSCPHKIPRKSENTETWQLWQLCEAVKVQPGDRANAPAERGRLRPQFTERYC